MEHMFLAAAGRRRDIGRMWYRHHAVPRAQHSSLHDGRGRTRVRPLHNITPSYYLRAESSSRNVPFTRPAQTCTCGFACQRRSMRYCETLWYDSEAEKTNPTVKKLAYLGTLWPMGHITTAVNDKSRKNKCVLPCGAGIPMRTSTLRRLETPSRGDLRFCLAVSSQT